MSRNRNTEAKDATEFDRRQFQKVFKDQRAPRPGKSFTDDLFPPNDLSLCGNDREKNVTYLINPKEVEWKRAKELIQDPVVFEGSINFDSLRLGEIADTYFHTAIAALAPYPNLINQIFITKQSNEEGVYQLSLFIDGQFQIVYVDDFFPCKKVTNKQAPILNLFFSRTTTFEIWGMLLEKAWAKVNGGYGNIITGSISDVLRAFTGFSCQFVISRELDGRKKDKEKEAELNFVQKLKSAFNNRCIVCGTTRGDESKLKKFGLEPGCSYNILYGDEVMNEQNKKYYLVKLKNSWGGTVWNGDFAENSKSWTDTITEQIATNHLSKKSDAEFWMSSKDLYQYFDHLDICQPIFGGNTKFFDFRANDLNCPHVFNIYIQNKATLAVSALEKKWRFNRELKNISHPTSLILAEYNPETSELKKVISDFNCENDVEVSKKVDAGYYIVWVFKPLDVAQKPKPEFMRVKFCCDEEFAVNYIGADEEYLVISDIIAQNVRYKNRNKMERDGSFYDIQNSFDKSGIAYRLVLNDSSDYYESWNVDATGIEGITLLPPYKGAKKFNFKVAPNSYAVILGIQNSQFGNLWFNLKSEAHQVPFDPVKNKINNPKADPKTIYTDKFDSHDQNYDYVTASYDDATTIAKFPILKAHEEQNKQKLRANMPKLLRGLSEKNPEVGKMRNLVAIEHKKGDISFMGEANIKDKKGRGVFHDDKTDMTLVASWTDPDQNIFGRLYDSSNTLIYDGEMVDGIFHGKGTLYLPSGEKYVGNFVHGVMEGNGVFYWNDGSRWEGTFSNNKLDGDGVFYNPKSKTSFNANYRNNRLVQEHSSRRNIHADDNDEDDY